MFQRIWFKFACMNNKESHNQTITLTITISEGGLTA
jgi:hypothetical protein